MKPDQLIPDGTPLQISDSSGNEVKMGDYIKMDVTGNQDLHGLWAFYKIKCQGPFPIMSYVTSEKKKVFPTDYTAGFLSDEYDHKAVLFAIDTRDMTPCGDTNFYAIDREEAEAFIASQENPYQKVENK